MRPGRKPLPTALKVLRGNPGRRPLNDREPDADPLEDLTPPADLDPEAAVAWARLAPTLHAAGLLTPLSTDALTLLCTSIARRQLAERELRKHGYLVKSPNGYPIQNPYFAIAAAAHREVERLLVEFGLTPSSKARVTAAKRSAPSAAATKKRFFGTGA